jgi:hypothetical protein
MNHRTHICLSLSLAVTLSSCGAGQPTDPEPTPDILAESCADFCAVEQVCVAPNLREAWEGFETEQECTDYCVSVAYGVVVDLDQDECVGIFTAMWNCAATLPTCEDFEWFDLDLQSQGHLDLTCSQEIQDYFDFCNG